MIVVIRKYIVTWILVIILLAATFFLPSVLSDIIKTSTIEHSTKKIFNTYSSNDLKLSNIEIADTASKQEQGLMYRNNLCAECAMLFVYSYPSNYAFWMKNTKFSLDIIFLDETGKIINIHKNTEPLDINKKYEAQSYYWYVLEVRAGFSDKYNLKPGDIINIQDLILKSGALTNNK